MAAPAAGLSGGAAILAQMRARNKKAPQPVPAVTFVYGSQTGTAQEIARNLHAEAVQRGMKAEVGACTLGMLTLTLCLPFLCRHAAAHHTITRQLDRGSRLHFLLTVLEQIKIMLSTTLGFVKQEFQLAPLF